MLFEWLIRVVFHFTKCKEFSQESFTQSEKNKKVISVKKERYGFRYRS